MYTTRLYIFIATIKEETYINKVIKNVTTQMKPKYA